MSTELSTPRSTASSPSRSCPDPVAADPDRLARFLREAKAASALNHPNILTVYDLGCHDATHSLVTEFVDGRTLREWSAEAHPPLADVLGVVAQAATAIGAADAGLAADAGQLRPVMTRAPEVRRRTSG